MTLLGFRCSSRMGFTILSCISLHEVGSQSRPYDRLMNVIVESEPVFSRIREMLVNRCPNLESLTVAGTSAEPLDILRLLTSYWPRLRSLTIGEPTSEMPAPVNPALVHTVPQVPRTALHA